MNLIVATLKAIDFHLYDRQGQELTLWHHGDDQVGSKHGAFVETENVTPTTKAGIQVLPE